MFPKKETSKSRLGDSHFATAHLIDDIIAHLPSLPLSFLGLAFGSWVPSLAFTGSSQLSRQSRNHNLTSFFQARKRNCCTSLPEDHELCVHYAKYPIVPPFRPSLSSYRIRLSLRIIDPYNVQSHSISVRPTYTRPNILTFFSDLNPNSRLILLMRGVRALHSTCLSPSRRMPKLSSSRYERGSTHG